MEGKRAWLITLCTLLALPAVGCAAASGQSAVWQEEAGAGFRVLVFTRTEGFRHDSIPSGVEAIRSLGAQHGFVADWTEDATVFSDETLSRYRAVIFLSTTGDVLDPLQQGAFERYIRGGNGYVGIHSATDTEYDWPWYGGLVGAYFSNHPSIQAAAIHIEDRSHPSTEPLPDIWLRTDEWYDFRANPRGSVTVLASLDEGTYAGGGMGADHPIAWYHEYDSGRAWYTAGGHTSESYSEPLFVLHILGGILYAAGVEPSGALEEDRRMGIGSSAPAGALVLFAGDDVNAWERADRSRPIDWPINDGALVVRPGRGDIQTVDSFLDFQLHLEFWLPSTPSDAPEQDRANSGVYLQSRYELQVLDAFGKPVMEADGAGAIYGMWGPGVNAGLPAETWQSYDVVFRAARWSDGRRTEPARVTVWWNGVLVHDNVPLSGSTAGGMPETSDAGPIRLQDHGHLVRYRNIWLVPLANDD